MTKADKALAWAWGISIGFGLIIFPVTYFLFMFFGASDTTGFVMLGSSIAGFFLQCFAYLLTFVVWILCILSTWWYCDEMNYSKLCAICSILCCGVSLVFPTSCFSVSNELLVYKKSN